MRNITAISNIANNYLKTGIQPRTVVRIPSLDLDLTTTIKSSGTISRTAKPFGGYEQAAQLTISNLILDSDVKFCTEATLSPYNETVINTGSGTVYSMGAPGDAYLDVRNASNGTRTVPTITVGQTYSAGFMSYLVYRGFLQFSIPSALTTCEEATIYLPGIAKYALSDFNIVAVSGDWSSVADSDLFSSFDGHQASGDYTDHITVLGETLSTSEFFAYDATLPENEQHVLLRLNDAGREAVENAAGGTLRIMLLSSRDVTATEPSRDEFAMFTAADTQLKLRYNQVNLDNKPVYVYRYYGDTQPSTYAEMLELFRGVVKDHRIGLRTLTITIQKNEGELKRTLPDGVITKASYYYCHSENVGKSKPIIYGDFSQTKEFIDNTGYFTEEENDAICSSGDFFVAYNVNDFTGRFMVAGHAIKQIGGFAASWNSGIDAYSIVPCIITEISDGIYQIERGSSSNFPYYLTSQNYPTSGKNPVVVKIPKYNYVFSGEVSERNNSVDSNPDNWSAVTAYADAWFFSTREIGIGNIPNPSWGVSGLFDSVAIVVETYAPEGYGSNNALKFRWIIYKDDGTTVLYDETEHITSDGQHVFVRENSNLPDCDVNFDVAIEGRQWIDDEFYEGFANDYPIYFKNICIVRGYNANLAGKIYLFGQGRPDDVYGTITGTPSSLIENPAHVIESIARNDLGLSSSSLDTTDLDTAAADLQNWKLAFQLTDETDGLKLLDKIGEQCKTSLFRDELDRLTADVWDADRGFAHSGTDIPDDLDIFQASGATTITSGIEYVTRNPIMVESLVIEQTPLNKVYNSFELKYRKNPATGGYREIITMDNGDGVAANVSTTLVSGDESYMENSQTIDGLKALCAQSYTDRENTTNVLTFEADCILDRATAVKLLQHLIETYTGRPYTVTFSTRENAIWLEFGDRINIRHSRINERFGAPTALRKKWAFYGIDHEVRTGEMRIKAIETTVRR